MQPQYSAKNPLLSEPSPFGTQPVSGTVLPQGGYQVAGVAGFGQPSTNLSGEVVIGTGTYGPRACSDGGQAFVFPNPIAKIFMILGLIFIWVICIPPLCIMGIIYLMISLCCRGRKVTFYDSQRNLRIDGFSGACSCCCKTTEGFVNYADVRDFTVALSPGIMINRDQGAKVMVVLKDGTSQPVTGHLEMLIAQAVARSLKAYLASRVGA